MEIQNQLGRSSLRGSRASPTGQSVRIIDDRRRLVPAMVDTTRAPLQLLDYDSPLATANRAFYRRRWRKTRSHYPLGNVIMIWLLLVVVLGGPLMFMKFEIWKII